MDVMHQWRHGVLYRWLVRVSFLRVQRRSGGCTTKRHRNNECSKSLKPRAQPIRHGRLPCLLAAKLRHRTWLFTGPTQKIAASCASNRFCRAHSSIRYLRSNGVHSIFSGLKLRAKRTAQDSRNFAERLKWHATVSGLKEGRRP